ncbi:hypothetical protein [Mangrovimonas cancribranchiae]|uniref:Uncharacterized protein n=1 Tax=Mangrovimonas cancribranchiae TaxID=3080055 RepID=A0AAU6P769_9FLAO
MTSKLLLVLTLFFTGLTFSQDKVKYTDDEIDMLKAYYFNEGFNTPARKKLSTLIMKDGTTYKGYCKSVITKKGQIHKVYFKDSISGDKMTLNVKDIAEAYLFASGMEKFNKASKKMNNWGMGRNSMSKVTSSDQIYFENQMVSLKNKKDKQEFLMQLLNPNFSHVIAVYHDPLAKETGGVRFGGAPKIGGGVIKSYYVKKGDKIIWLHKSDFEENYNFLFGDNEKFIKKYPYNAVDWDWFSGLVLEYTKMSSDKS